MSQLSLKGVLAKLLDNKAMIDRFYPVGSYYETSVSSFNPNTAWGGTWSLEASGKVHVSAGTGYTIGATGGEATHKLVVNELPSHTHAIRLEYGAEGNASYPPGGEYSQVTNNTNYGYYNTNTMIQSTGGNVAHNNMQPYIVVNRWHRTA